MRQARGGSDPPAQVDAREAGCGTPTKAAAETTGVQACASSAGTGGQEGRGFWGGDEAAPRGPVGVGGAWREGGEAGRRCERCADPVGPRV